MLLSAKDIENETWNVLLVSHGGWIRELIGCLLKDYSCNGIPPTRWAECCPNTGVTKFDIGVYRQGDVSHSSADCFLFQCRRHLNSMSDRTCRCGKCESENTEN